MSDLLGGDKNTHPISSVAIITILIAIGTAVLGAFWSLSDPRSELKNIRENFLSIREHNEFSARVQTDIRRIEEENRRQVSTDAFNAWRAEHEKYTPDLQRKMESYASKTEVEDLRKQLEMIRSLLYQHERDDRNLVKGIKP